MTDLAGQTWFITGASSGFGMAIAREVLERGGCVAATARDPKQLDQLAALAPDRVLALRLDVAALSEVQKSVGEAIERFSSIDVLVNNAGYGLLGAIEEADEAEIRTLFDVNVFGLASITRAVLPYMRRARGGCIVNFSSIAGIRAAAGPGYYAASKFAVEGLSEALAKEVAHLGISVLIVEQAPFAPAFPAARSESWGPSSATTRRLRRLGNCRNRSMGGNPVTLRGRHVSLSIKR